MTNVGTVIGNQSGRQGRASSDGFDLARMLVSELSGVRFEEVVFGKRYMTEQLGALCFLVAKQEDRRGIVDIGGNYRRIPEWAFGDEIVNKCPAYEPLVQIDCSVFDDGAVYRMCSRPAKEIFELGILYIDSLGYAKRIDLASEIHLNQYPTPENLKYTGSDFYVCSWVEVAQVAMEQNQAVKRNKFLSLVKLYCCTLHNGLCQCGFEPDSTAIELMSDLAVNKIGLDFKQLRSANPPSLIQVPCIDMEGLDPVEAAIRTVEANAGVIEKAMSFESDQRYRELILMHVMRILLAETEQESEELFKDLGEKIRGYYNCGRKIMKTVDQIVQRGLDAQSVVLRQIKNPQMRAYIRRNSISSNFVLKELCNTLLPFCEC